MKVLYLVYIENKNDDDQLIVDTTIKLISHSNDLHYIVNDNNSNIFFDERNITIRKCESMTFDILIIQNSFSYLYYKNIINKFEKIPSVFISSDYGLKGYTHPYLYDLKINVITESSLLSDNNITIYYPLIDSTDEAISVIALNKSILFFSSGVYTIDDLVINLCSKLELELIIVTDLNNLQLYRHFYSAYEFKIITIEEIVDHWIHVSLVIGTGYHIVRAIYDMKPCIVLGAKGYGGIVTLNKYDHLKQSFFTGRDISSTMEYIPPNLVELDILHLLSKLDRDRLSQLKSHIANEFYLPSVSKKLNSRFRELRVINNLVSKARYSELRPCLDKHTILVKKTIINNITYNNAIELSPVMCNVIEMCNGTLSITDIGEILQFDKEEINILFDNIYFLYRNKFLFFQI